MKTRKALPMFLPILILLLPVIARADDVTTPLSDVAFFQTLIQLMGGVKGASVGAIVVSVVQLAMTFFRTPMGNFAGKWKLILVTGLSVVAAVGGALITGQTLLQALLQGATLAALQVFANETVKHFSEEPSNV